METASSRAEPLAAIASALRQAVHVLPADASQLAAQLIGRLADSDIPGVQGLVEDASRWQGGVWLRPLTASLSRPEGPLLFTLTGHRGPLDAVVATGDGRLALSGDTDGVIKVWDLRNGTEMFTLTGHDSYITTIAVSRDGTVAVSGSYDKTLRVWDLETGSLRFVLTGHPASIFSLSITPDGRRAASGCRKTMRVWDLENGTELGSVRHKGNGLDVTIDADATHAICQGKKGILRMSLVNGEPQPPIKVKKAKRFFRVLSPDGRLALTEGTSRSRDHGLVPGLEASQDLGRGTHGILTKWDTRSGQPVHQFPGHEASIQEVFMTPDARHAATASSDETVRLWDLEADRCIQVIPHPAQVRTVALTPDARLAVSGSQDRIVRVWDLNRRPAESTSVAPLHSGGVSALALSPDERLLATVGGGEIRLWDIRSCNVVATMQAPAVRVAFAGSHRLLTAGWDDDPALRLWTVPEGKLRDVWEGHRKGVGALAADRSGRTAISGGNDLTHRLWDVTSGDEIWRGGGRSGLSDEGVAAAFSPDGRYAFVGCWNGTVKVISVGEGEQGTLEWHYLDDEELARRPDLSTLGHSTRSLISDIALDRSGTVAVSASADRTARVWDLAPNRCRQVLDHDAPVRGVGISADGSRVASAGEDLTLRVWHGTSGEQVAAFNGDAEFTCCAISGDGLDVVAGDAAGQVHFLRLEGIS